MRTTKLPLAFGKREEGGANTSKRAYLEETATILDAARAFYVAFFLFHTENAPRPKKSLSECPTSPNPIKQCGKDCYRPTHCSPGRSFRPSKLPSIPMLCPIGTSAEPSPIYLLCIADPSSRMPLAESDPTSRIWRIGNDPARSEASRACREPAIIPLSTKELLVWNCRVWI